MKIPEITHPLGKAWDQPNPRDIEIDETHALMTEGNLSELLDYSHSIPSAVYEGKMWKRLYRDNWILCWYSYSETPDHCNINERTILTVN